MIFKIRGIIPEGGALRVDQILPRLKPDLVRGVDHHREDMTTKTLRKKLVERSTRVKYVTKQDGDL
ncbi:hypothetical protein [Methylobacterium sp. WL6]|uniref:hypothetical protein n=1 Tax=Methylobacterium sp. WL6 TaxID=2603901 RepID=UPI0011CAFFEF|nr:hypothetical protein [Methylobacterium sp. WL6]TXN70483.1 hypothetical protein FV230_10550 [Methylobacterium sp. WL6]